MWGHSQLLNLVLEVGSKVNKLRTSLDTERKRVEEQVVKSKSMLQAVFDGISDPLMMLNSDFSVKMLNRSTINYYQASEFEKVIDRPCFKGLRGKASSCKRCKITSAVQSAQARRFEQKSLLYPDRFEEVVTYPLKEKDSGITGAIFRISDITEKKKTEEQLIRADRVSSLGQLSGGVAHEIRNPLSGISLFLDILSDKEKFNRTDSELEILDEIRGNVDRIREIIRRVLDFARPSVRDKKSVDINALIREEIKI